MPAAAKYAMGEGWRNYTLYKDQYETCLHRELGKMHTRKESWRRIGKLGTTECIWKCVLRSRKINHDLNDLVFLLGQDIRLNMDGLTGMAWKTARLMKTKL